MDFLNLNYTTKKHYHGCLLMKISRCSSKNGRVMSNTAGKFIDVL